jgi:predicted acetyltransferase
MSEQELQLVEPTAELATTYREMMNDFESAGEPHYAQELRDDIRNNFAGFVEKLLGYAKGIGLKEGHVPWSTYWLVCSGCAIGTSFFPCRNVRPLANAAS